VQGVFSVSAFFNFQNLQILNKGLWYIVAQGVDLEIGSGTQSFLSLTGLEFLKMMLQSEG